MNLYEHQAKEMFKQYGIPVPIGYLVDSETQVSDVYEKVGRERFGIIKAQVLTGGRGKAGGIRNVDSIPAAQEAVKSILGMKIKGLKPEKVLVEEKLDINKEYFISITIDPETSLPALLMSSMGGVDIEEISACLPHQIGKYVIDYEAALPSYATIDLARKLGFNREIFGCLVDIASKLYQIFVEKEATLIEINPIIETADGRLIAADGRLNVDDNALFRHPDLNALKIQFKEMVLRDRGIDYIDLGSGRIGLLCVGAGMTMLTMDLVNELGKAKCFLDISHGVNPQGFSTALDVLGNDPAVECVLLNMFGGLTRMDEIAQSLLQAIGDMPGGFSKPMVLRLQGTNADEGQSAMRRAGYRVFAELEDALAELKGILGDVK